MGVARPRPGPPAAPLLLRGPSPGSSCRLRPLLTGTAVLVPGPLVQSGRLPYLVEQRPRTHPALALDLDADSPLGPPDLILGPAALGPDASLGLVLGLGLGPAVFRGLVGSRRATEEGFGFRACRAAIPI